MFCDDPESYTEPGDDNTRSDSPIEKVQKRQTQAEKKRERDAWNVASAFMERKEFSDIVHEMVETIDSEDLLSSIYADLYDEVRLKTRKILLENETSLQCNDESVSNRRVYNFDDELKSTVFHSLRNQYEGSTSSLETMQKINGSLQLKMDDDKELQAQIKSSLSELYDSMMAEQIRKPRAVPSVD
eukprot:CFRG5450T1